MELVHLCYIIAVLNARIAKNAHFTRFVGVRCSAAGSGFLRWLGSCPIPALTSKFNVKASIEVTVEQTFYEIGIGNIKM